MADVPTFEEFKRDREALLSAPFNEQAMRAYMLKYNGSMHDKPVEILEAAFHKAITGLANLPLEHRKASKAWLSARNLRSFDDGDL